jgi:uncharacterized DUF497 family protein
MPEFEWNEAKNRKNTKKHKVDFEEAKTVFDDPHAIEFEASRNGE